PRRLRHGRPAYGGIRARLPRWWRERTVARRLRARGRHPRREARTLGFDRGPRPQALGVVLGLDVADGPGVGAHHQGVRLRVAAAEAHTAQQLAVGDPGGGEEDVGAAAEVVELQHAVGVLALGADDGALGGVARPEAPLHAAADTLHRAGGQDRLGRAADAHQDVDTGAVLHRRHQARGDVAVHDQLDPRPGGADLAEQLLVPLTVEHDHGEVLDAAALGAGDAAQVVAHGVGDVDDVGGVGTDDQLLHVGAVRLEHGVAIGQGDGGDAAGQAPGHQAGAVDGVDGDVDLRLVAVADVLADVQHRRLVLLALADDDDAVHVDVAEAAAHRVDRGAVGLLLVVAAHETGGRHGGALGDAHQLEGQVAVDGGAEVTATARRWTGRHGVGMVADPFRDCQGDGSPAGARVA